MSKNVNCSSIHQKGQTPVHYACTQEHLEAVEVLIGLGANVDAQDSEGNTPLHVATRTRHTAIAQLLLRTGANTELTDEVNNSSTSLRLSTIRQARRARAPIRSSVLFFLDGLHSASRGCQPGLQRDTRLDDSTRRRTQQTMQGTHFRYV